MIPISHIFKPRIYYINADTKQKVCCITSNEFRPDYVGGHKRKRKVEVEDHPCVAWNKSHN